VEDGESCDGNCPADCNDGNPCTSDSLSGSAQTCDAVCHHDPVQSCLDGDGCCPAGCAPADDSDCAQDCTPPEFACPQGCCSWQIETVTNASYINWDTQLSLDSQDRPLIGYTHYDPDDLRLATRDQGFWYYEYPDMDTGDDNIYLGMTIDAEDTIYIVYSDMGNQALKLASRPGGAEVGSWSVETLPAAGADPSLCSIALDAQGRVHIAYYDFDPAYDLRYLYQDENGWHDEAVYTEGHSGQMPNILLDSADRPHIVFQDPAEMTVRYARKDDDAWTVSVVDYDASLSQTRHTVLDSQDRPHVVYADVQNVDYKLRYAYWNGSHFTNSVVDSVNNPMDGSLALDSSDAAHIAYHDMDSSDLIYARDTGAGWELLRVDTEGSTGSSPCISVDSLDQPHISYRDHTDDRILYARW